jgi:hypothetical protein
MKNIAIGIVAGVGLSVLSYCAYLLGKRKSSKNEVVNRLNTQ